MGSFYCFVFILIIAGLWPFNFLQSNKASQDSVNGLCLTPPGTAYTSNPFKKLLGLREFTILLNLSSDFFGSNGYARILSYSLDGERVNFMIGQWKDSIVFKLRASENRGPIHFETEGVFKRGEKECIAIIFNGEKLLLYHHGRIRNEKKTGPLNFSNWDGSYPLVIGSEANGKSPWRGTIFSIALFDQAFPSEKIKSLALHVKDFSPLIHYTFNDGQEGKVIDHGKGEPAHLIIPRYFTPYERTILEKPFTQLRDYRCNMKDIMINVVGFVPLGFLLSFYLLKKGLPFRSSLLLSILTGFCLGLMIEVIQAFLPTRSSSMTDLIANTLGTAIGSFFPKLKTIQSIRHCY